MKQIIRWLARQFGMVAIDWKTAEYLSCISGQVPWGNQERRGKACHDLGFAMEGIPMSTSEECFSATHSPWEIIVKTKHTKGDSK